MNRFSHNYYYNASIVIFLMYDYHFLFNRIVICCFLAFKNIRLLHQYFRYMFKINVHHLTPGCAAKK